MVLDADGSMHPREIGRYVALLASGYDLVKGSRFMAAPPSPTSIQLRNLADRARVRR